MRKKAYTILDIGTYLKLKGDGRLPNIVKLVDEGKILLNIYSIYIVQVAKMNQDIVKLINEFDFWSIDSKQRLKIRRNLVYMHEKSILFKGKVIDNIIYPLIIRGYPKEKAKIEATRLLRELDINYLANRRRKELSAGEAQLVAFARAIISGADILILDEPTSALDLEHRRNLEGRIKELTKEGRKVIIATHDRLFAIKLSAKIYEINNGKISRSMMSEE